MIKWNSVIGRVSRTTHGTTEGRLYYWVRRDGVNEFRCGYYGFGREIEYRDKVFTTLNKARAFCVEIDANLVDNIIVEERANA